MGLLSPILRNGSDGRLTWWCPGCNHAHMIQVGEGTGPRWTWNGDAARPTFSPSVLVTWKEPSDVPEQFDDAAYDVPKVCHSFVVNGAMQFLGDCTHALAGQTVPIPTWPHADWRDG